MSAPEAAAPYAARQNGEYLVVDKGASLPGVCIKCGRTDGLHGRSHTFQSFDPALYLAFLVSGALALILLLWVRPKRGTLEFPICDACDRRWRRASGVWTVALLWLFVWSFVAYTLLGLGAVAAFLVLEIIAVIPAALVRWTVSELSLIHI